MDRRVQKLIEIKCTRGYKIWQLNIANMLKNKGKTFAIAPMMDRNDNTIISIS